MYLKDCERVPTYKGQLVKEARFKWLLEFASRKLPLVSVKVPRNGLKQEIYNLQAPSHRLAHRKREKEDNWQPLTSCKTTT